MDSTLDDGDKFPDSLPYSGRNIDNLRKLFTRIDQDVPMTLQESLDKLPSDRRDRIRKRAQELIQEELDRADNEGLVSENE